jgi:hypothetical protein
MKLTRAEISRLIRLLGVLQNNLESAIDSSTLPDGSFDKHADPSLRRAVGRDRRDWKQAEDIVKKLDAARRKGRV